MLLQPEAGHALSQRNWPWFVGTSATPRSRSSRKRWAMTCACSQLPAPVTPGVGPAALLIPASGTPTGPDGSWPLRLQTRAVTSSASSTQASLSGGEPMCPPLRLQTRAVTSPGSGTHVSLCSSQPKSLWGRRRSCGQPHHGRSPRRCPSICKHAEVEAMACRPSGSPSFSPQLCCARPLRVSPRQSAPVLSWAQTPEPCASAPSPPPRWAAGPSSGPGWETSVGADFCAEPSLLCLAHTCMLASELPKLDLSRPGRQFPNNSGQEWFQVRLDPSMI